MIANLYTTNATLVTAMKQTIINGQLVYQLKGDCAQYYSSFPNFEFMFDDKYIFNLHPSDYMVMFSTNCVLLVAPTDDQTNFGDSVIIGYSFLAGFYAAFDVANKRIGFAPLNSQMSFVAVVPHSEFDHLVDEVKSLAGWAIALIVIVVLLVVVVIIFLVRRYRLKKLEHNLEHYNDQTALMNDSGHGEKTFDTHGKAYLN